VPVDLVDRSENLVVRDQSEDLGILLVVIGPSATWHLLTRASACR